MRFSFDQHAFPGFFRDGHLGGGKLWIVVQEKFRQFFPKFFHARLRRFARQRVHRVFHGIGGEDVAVVAFDEAGFKVAGEENLHRPFTKIVTIATPFHLNQADA